MIRAFLVLFLASQLVVAGEDPSPCDDRQYMALRQKAISDMTPQEYDYFKTQKALCDAANGVEGAKVENKSYKGVIITGIIVAAVIALLATKKQRGAE